MGGAAKTIENSMEHGFQLRRVNIFVVCVRGVETVVQLRRVSSFGVFVKGCGAAKIIENKYGNGISAERR